MADQGRRDHPPEAWTDDPDDWPCAQSGSGQPPPGWPAPPGYTTAPPAGTGRGGRGGRGFTVAAVAVVAAVAAGIVALVALSASGHQTPASSAGNVPAAQAPAAGDNGGAGPIGGQGGGNGAGTLFLAGQVTKVSRTSITVTAQGHQITAAITSSTTFAGVHSPTQIKPGDQITAQITGYDGPHPVAAAIQDPASIP
jgi:hypothetical protein